MRAAIALLVLLVACTDTTGGNEDDGMYVDIDVTSAVPFTELLVFEPSQAMAGRGILTPEMQAAGTKAPATAMLEQTRGVNGLGTGELVTDYAMHTWDIAGGPSRLNFLAVVAQPDGSLVPVAYAEARLTYHPKDDYASEASGTVPLAALAGPVELWGAGTTLCVRMIDDTTGATTYLVSDWDRDCDGIANENDCQPDAYCNAANPTELAACTMGTGC